MQAQYIARRQEYLKYSHSKIDLAAAAQDTLQIINSKWHNLGERMEIVPGKAILATLRRRVRERFSVNVSNYRIVSSFRLDEIPSDLKQLIEGLENSHLKEGQSQQLQPSTPSIP